MGFALTDSPVSQLAWIEEKFKEHTDPEKGLPEDNIDRDRILTDVSIYWLTGIAASSAQGPGKVLNEAEKLEWPVAVAGVVTVRGGDVGGSGGS
ncbi:hypothetical protein [Actinoplanes sp. NPDC026670]|uniref:hypothetical protein n=1 Tax=Actinoplanes sp. NPDC026670 TaxID=3154700 RepID=UPI0033D0BF60